MDGFILINRLYLGSPLSGGEEVRVGGESAPAEGTGQTKALGQDPLRLCRKQQRAWLEGVRSGERGRRQAAGQAVVRCCRLLGTLANGMLSPLSPLKGQPLEGVSKRAAVCLGNYFLKRPCL